MELCHLIHSNQAWVFLQSRHTNHWRRLGQVLPSWERQAETKLWVSLSLTLGLDQGLLGQQATNQQLQVLRLLQEIGRNPKRARRLEKLPQWLLINFVHKPEALGHKLGGLGESEFFYRASCQLGKSQLVTCPDLGSGTVSVNNNQSSSFQLLSGADAIGDSGALAGPRPGYSESANCGLKG